MDRNTMDCAAAEARRFLSCVHEMERLIATERKNDPLKEKDWWPWRSMQSGALRRASLDLTRALARLRRP